jgi:hypothetical protein
MIFTIPPLLLKFIWGGGGVRIIKASDRRTQKLIFFLHKIVGVTNTPVFSMSIVSPSKMSEMLCSTQVSPRSLIDWIDWKNCPQSLSLYSYDNAFRVEDSLFLASYWSPVEYIPISWHPIGPRPLLWKSLHEFELGLRFRVRAGLFAAWRCLVFTRVDVCAGVVTTQPGINDELKMKVRGMYEHLAKRRGQQQQR